MFRVVSEFVPAPMYLLMCDDARCAISMAKPVASGTKIISIETPTEATGENQAAFIDEARSQGWLIGLGMQLCPGHHHAAAERSKQATEQRRIVVPQIGLRA